MICFSFVFVACSPKNPTTDDSGSSGKPSNETETTENSLILSKLYSKIYNQLNLEELGTSYVSGDGKEHYNDFIFAGLSVLNEVSKINNLKNEEVYSGNKLNISDFEGNYVDKIEKLYFENSKKDDVCNVKLFVLGAKQNYEECNLNIALISYDISFNEKTENFNLQCNIEKTNGTDFNSDSNYYSFEYSFDKDKFINEIQTYSFYRNKNFDFENLNFNELASDVVSSVKNFERICYDFNLNATYYPSSPNDNKVVLSNNEVIEFITDSLKTFSFFRGEIEEMTSSDEILNDDLSEKLIYILNSNKIDDFKDKLTSDANENE